MVEASPLRDGNKYCNCCWDEWIDHLYVNSDKAKRKNICTKKKKGGININLEIGGNSQTMFYLPIDQAEPYNLNFEAQMHQSLNNKQHVLEVTYPVMFCTISVSTPHRRSKLLSQKK